MDWKPGDVAMVKCSDGNYRRAAFLPATIQHDEAWQFADGACRRVADSVARPLAVIDPENPIQVAVLQHAYHREPGRDYHMRRALREFAESEAPWGDPAPEPDEPTYATIQHFVNEDPAERPAVRGTHLTAACGTVYLYAGDTEKAHDTYCTPCVRELLDAYDHAVFRITEARGALDAPRPR